MFTHSAKEQPNEMTNQIDGRKSEATNHNTPIEVGTHSCGVLCMNRNGAYYLPFHFDILKKSGPLYSAPSLSHFVRGDQGSER
jgi:hypothetical protein